MAAGPELVTLFRAATEDDLIAIVRLLAEDAIPVDRELTAEPLDPRYVHAFAAIARDPNQLLVVAEDAGEVVGTLQLTYIPGLSFRGAWRGQIESVRVASHRRNAGLGEALIAWAVERCRDRGCRMVQLTSTNSRTAAHRFYARLGWTASHTGFKLQPDDGR
ncbi:N-acetyltransferase family protein [Sphingomonas sp.]|uniref:GNAT family N-acetyltransferase n=1 Tax=Sphingomonas sp. TaxID=28214 RepID=UPI003AFF614C